VWSDKTSIRFDFTPDACAKEGLLAGRYRAQARRRPGIMM
jgi:hypothetical protein